MTGHPAVDAQLFGLAGTFPRPGWVVIDAARDHRFTGELAFETSPEVRVYLDRGRIYLAERVPDPSLGARLVDAGALNAAQLEHGAMRLGESEYLGRLFERVPSVDRHAVLITAEMMTEECVGWLAGQHVRTAAATPYRHHPSGVHRWDRPADCHDLVPGDPLPAPAPDEEPIEISPPEPLFPPGGPIEPFDDDMIRWDLPSFLDSGNVDERPEHPEQVAGIPTPPPSDVDTGLGIRSDWIERLTTEGLPDRDSDPLARATALPSIAVEPPDRFEVIWPSGEIDDQFGGSETASLDGHHPDLDRAGPTARLASTQSRRAGVDTLEPETVALVEPDDGTDERNDDVVLAVRRAVTSIETGWPVDRQHAESPAPPETTRAPGLIPPGRVAVRDEVGEWSSHTLGTSRTATRSVFDEVPPEPDDHIDDAAQTGTPDSESERSGALRRLIGSLRRR